MILYRKIEIQLNDVVYVVTKGLKPFIDKKIRVVVDDNRKDDYVDVINILLKINQSFLKIKI